MNLILMRHGRAEERGAFAADGHSDDALRPLTDEGRKRIQHSLTGLHMVIPATGLVVTSPLLRAQATAEIVAESFSVPLKESADMAPGGDRERLTRWLNRQEIDAMILVGHEPDLGAFASWCLTGSEESFITLKKGGIALLHFDDKVGAAEGTLELLLSSAQLRRITS